MNQRALQMIDNALFPLIRNGRRIDRIQLYVCASSPIAEYSVIKTKFGLLRVNHEEHAKKGLAYLLEDPGKVGRGFAWVSRPKGNDSG